MRIKKGAMVGTQDVQSGQDQGASIPPIGPAEIVMDDIKVVDAHQMKDKAEHERFMNEMVTIRIEADDDPNSAIFVPCGHNGTDQYIRRGVDQTIKRKFLYSLLAAKRKQFACSFGKDGSGQEFNRLEGRARPTHSLHVVRDDNPSGRDWFTAVMQEA